MKKNLVIAILGLTSLIFAASCSKDKNESSSQPSTAQGTWSGTGQYGTSGGNPTYIFSLDLKADGTVSIVGNNSVAIDNATGTWQMVQDSVKATYRYAASSAIYTLSARYYSNSNVMVGTIGLSPVTSGVVTFTVTRQ